LPWLKGAAHRDLQRMREYLRLAFQRVPIGVQKKKWFQRLVHNAIAAPARWRLDHDFYQAPVELWLKDRVNRLAEPPRSKVDAHMLQAEAVTC
jgi:hypothetical protein